MRLCVLLRSCRPEGLFEKVVLKSLAKVTGKQLCQSLFFNKVVDLRTAILLIKRLGHRCFPVSFAKFLRTAFLIEHLWQLLLSTIHVFYFDFCKETLKRNIFPLNFLDYSFVVFYNEVRHSLVTKSSYPN